MATVNLKGRKFGRWKVVGSGIRRKEGENSDRWPCKCDCGTRRNVLGATLLKGRSASCGCAVSPGLVGKHFGRLTVISDLGGRVVGIKNNRKRYWLCRCACGNKIEVAGSHLQTDHTQSCGCLRDERSLEFKTKHGLSGTPEYQAWCDARRRCTDPNNAWYKDYGGRGIKMCRKWLNDPAKFVAYIGKRPDRMSLDRIDSNSGYRPGNVRWATKKQQGSNTRRNIILEFRGEKMTVTEAARRFGKYRQAIQYWLRKGLSPDKALSKAVTKKR